jgi:predicted enzyme related to lactoylglutathione lyase
MPEILINVDVPDLDAGARFYTAAFGLRVGRRFGSDAVELLGGTAPIYLLAARAGSPPAHAVAAVRDYARHWTPVHFDFVVDDLDAAVRRAEGAGATREGELGAYAFGRMARLSDPFGNGFCLLRFEGRGYDEIATE